MCGLCGILRLDPEAAPVDRDELVACRDAMVHRGPDDEGLWRSGDGAVGLGHRRLAILDPTPAGAQPMASADGRFRIVYNGEIYNFRRLREELAADGATFTTGTDTEVILALFARHGGAGLARLRGMYALALWDAARRRLTLARDPDGIKPLYWTVEPTSGADAGHLLAKHLRFASTVGALERALEHATGRAPAVSTVGLAGFLLWGSVPEPWTIRRGVHALPAGATLTLTADRGLPTGRAPEPLVERPFDRPPAGWGLDTSPDDSQDDPDDRLAAALEDSVEAHLVSDVPVATFLSAGLDSTLVTGLAARRSRALGADPPTALTLRFAAFADTDDDEGPLAAAVARSLGVEHRERTVDDGDLAALADEILAAMDQPSIDGANTWLVARLAAEEGFKVALSGTGGDELFGSYPSFAQVPRLARLLAGPAPLAGATGLASAWAALARRLAPGRPKLAGLLDHGGTLGGAYLLRRGLFLPRELPALLDPAFGAGTAAAALEALRPVEAAEAVAAPGGPVDARQDPFTAVHRLETALYLRHQLLRDADWAGMASSVEIRVPLVDTALRATLAANGFAASRRGRPGTNQAKAALVRRLLPELPPRVLARPKTGFSLPLAALAGVPPKVAGTLSRGRAARHLARRVARAWGVELGVKTGIEATGSDGLQP